ncbi:putative secondary metabolism biosynthetic enzyme [Diaporthe australafricana]|uniref:Secondary metabolism biosynthetic enzyme n=1 Tax=Diaporthe australafricana TaxID=127596 RepID=A0ABR3W3G8_9PEZI
MSMKSNLTQTFPPKPSFTEKNLSDLSGKVYIVTGANAGTGKELTRILYSKNATVYMLARSADKTNQAVTAIKNAVPSSTGTLRYLRLDLADLASIKGTVEQFLAVESKLHVLWNNAGVMSTEKEITTTLQGYEQHVGVNVLGGFLLAKLLTPVLVSTAQSAPPNTARVVWVASMAAEMFAEKNMGATPEMMKTEVMAKKSPNERYWHSKVGNWAHGVEYALRHQASGVISVPLNPGNLQSELYRDQGFLMKAFVKLLMYSPVNGAYTELFAGLSPDITLSKTGCWVVPFGRVYPIREDLNLATKPESEGGTGGTLKFWEWTEEQVRPYL